MLSLRKFCAALLSKSVRWQHAVEMRWDWDPEGWGAGVVWFQDADSAWDAQQSFDGVALCAREMTVCVGAWVWREEQLSQELDGSGGGDWLQEEEEI